ncbi:MAG: L-idonate 5-dehydrogenase [Deltaproteobacteria bacterium]|nr:MAG: L-idonate 5-dehydrogenase [Deltaproteobacteria bacterium]
MPQTAIQHLSFDACYIRAKKDLYIGEKTLDFSPDSEVLVKITRGGICGSDVHYYQHGGIGDISLKHPMVLGHEVIGTTVPAGSAAAVNVAVNPSRPCNGCVYCLSNRSNQCMDMLFFGSAMRTPHVDGGFAQYVAVRPDQCIPYAPEIAEEIMAFTEPLAVALHALNKAGGVLGKKVLVTGAGPIGLLVTAACRAAGAMEIIVTDLVDKNRRLALVMGADSTRDPMEDNLAPFTEKKGYFDVSFEASGAIPAIQSNINFVQSGGTMVQIGMGPGMVDIPLTTFLAKEIRFTGAFRFNEEFTTAVRWLEKGLIDPRPLLTEVYDYNDIEEAINLAADKSRALKVQLSFT